MVAATATPTLFDKPEEADSIQERFEQFHSANPRVFQLFKHFAEEKLAAGRTRYSADAILHRVRWEIDLQCRDEGFKINNNFSSRYARMLSAADPRFADFFEFRQLQRN